MTTPGRIVVGVDDRAETGPALDWAVQEAVSRRCALHVLTAYVVPPPYADVVWTETGPTSDWPERHRLARATVDRAVARAGRLLAAAGAAGLVPLSGQVVRGPAAEALAATTTDAAVLVLGARRRGGVLSAVLGAVSDRAVARATCPVVVVRGVRPETERGPVVVGVDPHGDDDAVLGFAVDQAHRSGASLLAVTSWIPTGWSSSYHEDTGWVRDDRRTVEARVTARLAPWQDKYDDLRIRRLLSSRDPVTLLAESAAEARMLVVGLDREHHQPVLATAMGSIAYGVLHHADTCVAVVPC